MSKIDTFKGEYDWLSNFYPCLLTYEGKDYSTLEHAFQAAKCAIPMQRETIRKAAGPAAAKRHGKMVSMRKDWPTYRLVAMEELLRQKFQYVDLKAKLLATGDAELIEGNNWNDYYWGVCRGRGENHLGKLLMKIRKELMDEQSK